ncbi:MAG: hypothetical protein AAFV07_16275, partial [Bacteroidota bacterium]
MHVFTLLSRYSHIVLLICLTGFLSACGGGNDSGGNEDAAATLSKESKVITWKDLSAVKFTNRYYPDLEEYLLFPSFDPSVKALNGKTVQIEGYVIPVEPG